jgi:hypothetical protein
VPNDEIYARIRKAVTHAFGGFQNVHAVLFVGGLGLDNIAIEAIPTLRTVFNNEISTAEKLIVLTRAEKDIVEQDYARREELQGIQFSSDYQYSKADYRSQLKVHSDYKKTPFDEFYDGVLPFGANEVTAANLQGVIGEEGDLTNFSASKYATDFMRRPFEFISDAVSELFFTLFKERPRNFEEVQTAAWQKMLFASQLQMVSLMEFERCSKTILTSI